MDDVSHHAPHTKLLIRLDAQLWILTISWHQPHMICLHKDVLHRKFVIHDANRYIPILKIDGAIHHENISSIDVGIDHRIAHHLSIKSAFWMRNQFSIQVDFLLILRRYGRGKPCLWSALGKWEGGAFVKFYALNDELRHDEK